VRLKPARERAHHGGMGKLVACKGCGGEVSAAAKACPKCGQPVKRGIGVGKIVLIAVVALLIAGAVGASQKKDKERREVASPSTPPVEVSAVKLASDYKANEVSADQLYRNKVLRVSGVVDGIKKDFSDDPYVVLRTGNQFLGVHARFEEESGLAGLTPGKEIVVRCLGNNVIMGSPMLKNCILEK